MHYTHDYDCGCHAHHGHERGIHHWGGCGTPGHPHRRFFSKEETINRLQEYLGQLQAEAKGVEEYIDKLRKEES